MGSLGFSRARTIDDDTGKPYRCYDANGIDFWYHDEKFVNNILLTRGDPFPKPWQRLGFSWKKSYEDWVALLTGMGYSIKVQRRPRKTKYDGHDSFSAEVVARKETPLSLEITLDFDYGRGTATTSPGDPLFVDREKPMKGSSSTRGS